MDARIRAYWRLPLRILLGISFVYHGLPKFTGGGHAGFVGFLHGMGMPVPGLLAWVVKLVEVLGGIALILGALVPIATILLIVEMLVAMVTVHLPHGFNFVNIVGMTQEGPRFGMPGAEVNLLYIAALLALLIGGPGPLSVDERVKTAERRLKLPWGRHEPVRTG